MYEFNYIGFRISFPFKSIIRCVDIQPMMTSSNGNIFRVTGPLCGEFTGPGEFPHKGQWRGALMFSLTCVWISGWVNDREAADLRRHRGHYDVNVICSRISWSLSGNYSKLISTWTVAMVDYTYFGIAYAMTDCKRRDISMA